MIYLVNMSKGESIKIDEEDLIKLQENMSAPLIRVKQAIINPSFMVSITPTEEKEFFNRRKIQIAMGIAEVVGEEKVKTLADKMTITKKLN